MIASLHALGATLILAAVVTTGFVSAVGASRLGTRSIDRLRLGLTGIIGLEVAIGAVLYLSGSRPREALHLLYGIAALALLPVAGSFAAEAPARARAWVLTVACVVLLLVAWRLAATG